jgi:hypothetical protein
MPLQEAACRLKFSRSAYILGSAAGLRFDKLRKRLDFPVKSVEPKLARPLLFP